MKQYVEGDFRIKIVSLNQKSSQTKQTKPYLSQSKQGYVGKNLHK